MLLKEERSLNKMARTCGKDGRSVIPKIIFKNNSAGETGLGKS
jgi:hypothetical protein